MPGINIAEIIRKDSLFSYTYRQNGERRKLCFFISHKDEDTQAARELGQHIMEDFGYNIYLDIFDQNLQKADINNDADGIVNAIQQGLLYASHLLCLISDHTRDSWWVPYEIGYAQANGVYTASIKLKESEYLPTFLRIHDSPVFLTISELDHYLTNNGPYGALFSKNTSMPKEGQTFKYFNT